MAVKIIKCSVCSEVLGTLEKPVITDLDVETYRQMVTCSSGHRLEDISLVEEEV